MWQVGTIALNVVLAAGVGAPKTVEASFSATFVPGIPAVTYDFTRVPETGKVRVALGTNEITLAVAGLEPNYAFGAHLHTGECGPTGADAGPHYQHNPDPAGAESGDPAYANAGNEVWLDLTTDSNGVGSSTARHSWAFDPQRPPRSLIIHSEPTKTAPGRAGQAGSRLACVNLP